MDYTAHMQVFNKVSEDELAKIVSPCAMKLYLKFQCIGASDVYHIMPDDVYEIDGLLYNPAKLTGFGLSNYLDGLYVFWNTMLIKMPECFTEKGRKFFSELYD